MTIEANRPSARAERAELRRATAEGRMVQRVLFWMLVIIPVCAGLFALLVFIATRVGGVPSGTPVLMGAGIGVLAGVFFGMWVGVVASVHDVEHLDLAPLPELERPAPENDAGDDTSG
jgi:hypothetical protein